MLKKEQLRLIRLKKQFQFFVCPAPKEDPWNYKSLHHYTSIDTLTKIVSNSSIQASSLYYLNDPEEFRYAYSKLIDVLNQPIYSAILEKDPASGWEAIWGGDVSIPDTFVACFSENADSLPMWLAYADGARGANIAFPLSLLNEIDGWQLVKVRYDASVVEQYFAKMLLRAARLINDVEYDERRAVVAFVSRAVHILSASLKRDEYAHEAEWRLVCGYYSLPGEISYRSNGRWIIPSTSVPFYHDDTRISVVCGPLAPFELLQPVLLRMFKRAEKYEPWPAVKSSVFYRG